VTAYPRGAPGERSGFPPFAGLALAAATTRSPLRGNPDRSGRPGPIWRRATAPGRSTPSAVRGWRSRHPGRFSRSGNRTPPHVHRIPPRRPWRSRAAPLSGTG